MNVSLPNIPDDTTEGLNRTEVVEIPNSNSSSPSDGTRSANATTATVNSTRQRDTTPTKDKNAATLVYKDKVFKMNYKNSFSPHFLPSDEILRMCLEVVRISNLTTPAS
jgi:hypothetical protein